MTSSIYSISGLDNFSENVSPSARQTVNQMHKLNIHICRIDMSFSANQKGRQNQTTHFRYMYTSPKIPTVFNFLKFDRKSNKFEIVSKTNVPKILEIFLDTREAIENWKRVCRICTLLLVVAEGKWSGGGGNRYVHQRRRK